MPVTAFFFATPVFPTASLCFPWRSRPERHCRYRIRQSSSKPAAECVPPPIGPGHGIGTDGRSQPVNTIKSLSVGWKALFPNDESRPDHNAKSTANHPTIRITQQTSKPALQSCHAIHRRNYPSSVNFEGACNALED